MFVGEWIERWSRIKPHEIAILYGEDSYTYKELFLRIDSLTGSLIAGGIKKGDRIAVLSYNCPQYLEIYFASARIGAILVPLNYRLATRELEYILTDSGASMLIFHQDFAESARSFADNTGVLPVCLRKRGFQWAKDYENYVSRGTGNLPLSWGIRPQDPHILMYTSGSTGVPKGAVLSYKKTFFNTLNADIYYGFSPHDVMIITRPMFHSGGLLVQATPILFKGGTAVIQPRTEAHKILRAIETNKVKVLEAPATVYNMMLNETDLDHYDLSSLRVCYTGGERVSEGLLREFHSRGFPLSQIFGQTETSTLTWLNPHDAVRKAGSVGKPVFFGKVKIVNPGGEEVETGETGEIVASGPILMSGYWNRPGLTAEIIEDNWLHTGDLARRDEESFIYIVDRLKNMFISGGENIYPAEVEKVLLENDKVEDVALYGVPDDKWGEVGRALIVLKNGQTMTKGEIVSFCEGKIAKFKTPKYVEFVKELPKTAAGKIMRYGL